MYAVIWTFMKMNKNAAAVLLSQRDVNTNRNREPPCGHLFPRSPPMNGFLPLFPKSKILIPIFSLHDFGLCSPIPQNGTPEMATTLNLTCALAFGKTHNSVPEYFKHVCLGRLQPIFKGTEQRLHRLHVCGHCCVVDLHCGKTTFHHTENGPNKESPCKPQQ